MLLGEHLLHLERQYPLLEFVHNAFVIGEDGVFNYLLRDSGAALVEPRVRDVDKNSAQDCLNLDAVIGVKVGVLNRDNRVGDVGRNLVKRDAGRRIFLLLRS